MNRSKWHRMRKILRFHILGNDRAHVGKVTVKFYFLHPNRVIFIEDGSLTLLRYSLYLNVLEMLP